jgi:hypothetical protein
LFVNRIIPAVLKNKSDRLRVARILLMARMLKLPILRNMFEAVFFGGVV